MKGDFCKSPFFFVAYFRLNQTYTMKKIKVLFVCLGNICRSPMAEGIFKALIKSKDIENYFEVDSAGTSGIHAGSLPDERMILTAKKHGVNLDTKAREIKSSDFEEFDYVLSMDKSNRLFLDKLLMQVENPRGELYMMRNFDDLESCEDVEDPYYGNKDGFDATYQILLESNTNFLEYLIERHQLNVPLR